MAYDVLAFIDRCAEIRDGSPNAFYAHVDTFCKQVQDAHRSLGKYDDEATAELLHTLSALYPLPDDATRVERAGRTAFALKRWLQRQASELEQVVLKAVF